MSSLVSSVSAKGYGWQADLARDRLAKGIPMWKEMLLPCKHESMSAPCLQHSILGVGLYSSRRSIAISEIDMGQVFHLFRTIRRTSEGFPKMLLPQLPRHPYGRNCLL